MPVTITPEEAQDLQAAAAALRLAIVSGTLEVTYDGRTIRYRSLGELKAALQQAEDWIAGPNATARRPTYGIAGFSRGT